MSTRRRIHLVRRLLLVTLVGHFATAAWATEPPGTALDPRLVQETCARVPAPTRQIASWSDVFALMHAASADLHISEQQVEVARGQRTSVVGRDLPQLLAFGSARRDLTSGRFCDPVSLNCVGDVTAYAATVSVAQHVVDFAGWAAIRAAGSRVEAQDLEAVDRRRTLTVALADAIAVVMKEERLAEATRLSVKDAAERAELIRQAVKLGALSAADTVRAEQDVTVALRAVTDVDGNLQRAWDALGALLGQDRGTGVREDFDLRGWTHGCSSGSPSNRADVQAGRRAVDAAQAEVQRTRLSLAPIVDVLGVFTLSSFPFVDGRHRSLTAGGTVTWPLFEGGRTLGELRASSAGVAQAREQLTATNRLATLEQDRAAARLRVAKEASQVAGEAQRLAAESERLSRAALKVGSGNALELIDAGRRLRESQAILVTAEIELVAAEIGNQLVSARCDW